MLRRDFIRLVGAVGLGLPVLAACEPITRVNFGPLQPSAVPNLHVPPGFTARLLATTGSEVMRCDGTGTGYVWHDDPDGGGVVPLLGGDTLTGWAYVSNSETIPGGAGAIVFDTTGQVTAAHAILSGTANNCSGGLVPTTAGLRWISCEEIERGLAYECDPSGPGQGIPRPAMGRFFREAVAADVVNHCIYQTEDRPDGGFYRFTPTTWGDLSSGLLEVMVDLGEGVVGWATVPDPGGYPVYTRYQNFGSPIKAFNGGEGVSITDGQVFFTTKGDNRLWRYSPGNGLLTVVYDDAYPTPSPRHLTGADNVVATTTNRVFVSEDGGNMEIVGVDVGTGATYPILRYDVAGSELAGPAFSPDGTRLYFSSYNNPGETFEVSGPWNQNAPDPPS